MAEPQHEAHLTIRGPGHEDTLHDLEEGITTFGRLPSNDIVLLGDLVSRHHSRITYFDGRATLQDLGSHNGSFVNGERVTTKVLKVGDTARVGNFQVFFRPGAAPRFDAVDSTATFDHQDPPAITLPPDGVPLPSQSFLLNDLQMARTSQDPNARVLRFVLRSADALAEATDLPSYMEQMLTLALEQTKAQIGVYLQAQGAQDPQVIVARNLDGPVQRPHVAMTVVNWVITKAFGVKSANLGEDIRFAGGPSQVAGTLSVLCVPLGPEGNANGAIYLSRSTPAFSDAELDALSAVAHLVNSGINRWSKGRSRGADASLSRLYSEGAAAQVQMRLQDAAGGLQPVDAVVLRAGLVGAGSAASHTRNRIEHTHFYDAWCETVLSVLTPLGAETSFGPGADLCAVFGPGPESPGLRAVQAALDLRAATQALVARHGEVGGCQLRAGIDHGRVMIGAVGGPNRIAWTALGDPVDIAARLQAAGPGGAILITDRLHSLCAPHFEMRARGEQRIRGYAAPLVVHQIVASLHIV